MASRKKEVQIQAEITSQEQWNEAMSAPGLTVVDVYQNWCGPCKAVQNLFRKIKMEYGDDLLHFAVAEAQSVEELCPFEGKCEPVFLFYSGGKAVGIVRGVKGPLLQKTILEKLEEEKKKQEMGSEYVPEVHDISFEEDTGKLEKMHSGETNEDQSGDSSFLFKMN
nr:PREDICTED: thioredoxin domain-containing protein 6-like [Lepisosteus oculatus]